MVLSDVTVLSVMGDRQGTLEERAILTWQLLVDRTRRAEGFQPLTDEQRGHLRSLGCAVCVEYRDGKCGAVSGGSNADIS